VPSCHHSDGRMAQQVMKAFRGPNQRPSGDCSVSNCSFLFPQILSSVHRPCRTKYGPMLRLLRNARANAQEHAFLVPTGVPVENHQYMLVFAGHKGQPYPRELWNSSGKNGAYFTHGLDYEKGRYTERSRNTRRSPDKTAAGKQSLSEPGTNGARARFVSGSIDTFNLRHPFPNPACRSRYSSGS
jgi:hypothetical protein